MGLKLNLSWFDKSTKEFVGEKYSEDLGENGSIIELLGLTIKDNINNGVFDVQNQWVRFLQPYFTELIEIKKYNYFISFDYADEWPDNNKQT
ncbi:colicin E3-like toxin immunity protein [Arsenophonus apicola]|uniref:colicin E3-like toxin immunity protein n=1 Tax=Arsenophonus apicola TaxID=2879119 RepID=UPI001CDC71AB|nr:colicin E3-like toxin immunity protein [Arsenophonus apicola]UBX30707.1 cloacin immunity family protein [Arsenophonus apicola]